MATEEWVEVQAPTVEKAVEAAVEELGLGSQAEADVEVIQEGQRGFLGIGGEDALVRVKKKSGRPRRRRGRGSRGRGSKGNGGSGSGSGGNAGKGDSKKPAEKPKQSRSNQGSGSRKPSGNKGSSGRPRNRKPREDDDRIEIPVDEQAADIQRFLEGLLGAYGLDGDVTTKIEDGVIYADVSGEQTEALVGPKGSIVQATLELCRTIVQRKTHSGARIRLDIAGYTERRREALKIYATRLADRVLEEGGEIMLEAMNSADRKVVHDSVSDIDGVRTFSEGEEPHRSVVISAE